MPVPRWNEVFLTWNVAATIRSGSSSNRQLFPDPHEAATVGRGLAGVLHVRVALPYFGDEISPRFCGATNAWVADWEGDVFDTRENVSLGRCPYPERLDRLAQHAVSLLICGGFPFSQLAEAERRGIRVLCGASGPLPTTAVAMAQLVTALRVPEANRRQCEEKRRAPLCLASSERTPQNKR